jgi:integrase
MGSLFKKKGSNRWQMGVCIDGQQVCKSTKQKNKRRAEKLLKRWETEVFEGKLHLPRSTPPYFEEWADKFLSNILHPSTHKRYASSIAKLKVEFAGVRLSGVSAGRIEDFKEARLVEGVEAATINHDLRVLRRMLRLAERKQLIGRNPFVEVEFLKQRSPRPPHIVTFDEEEKILLTAAPHIRVLVILILETGLRSHREALALHWDAVDFANDLIRVRESKTRAGIRNIPLSARCKNELLRWREMTGPDFSPFVFPNLKAPDHPISDIRKGWAKTLKDAGLEFFVAYNLRHTFASRLSASGVPDLFVAQMIGHSTPSILQRYPKAIDEYRREAIRKLEYMRSVHAQPDTVPTFRKLANE